MATTWPVNILPGATPTFYGGVNISQAVTYIRVRGSTYQAAIGAKARFYVNYSFYDGQIIRDQIDAAFMGRGPVSVLHSSAASGIITPFTGDLVEAVEASPVVAESDEVALMMQKSDVYTGQDPHQVVKAITEVRYYDTVMVSATVPAGNLLASYPIGQWLGDGSTIPQIDGSPYPTINPDDNNTDGPA